MKIVFTTCFRESKGGGCGRVSYEIARAFAQQGHEAVLIRPGEKTQIKKIAPHLRYLYIKSVGEGEVAIPYLTVSNLQFLFNFLEKFSPDIIHGQDFGPITLAVQFWTINNKIPFFYTAHVLPTKSSEFAISEFSKGFSRLMDTTLMKRYFFTFFKNCDAMIALNQAAKKDILKYGFREKIFIIPNGRELGIYRRCHPAKLSEKQKQLAFIGYLCKRKDQKYLLQMMEHLPDNYVLNLVGKPLNPAYLEELKNYVQKKHLKNINFLGELPYEKIPALLEKAHILVSASKMEVQSLVIIEALASGTPVVGLANETIDELVDDSVGFRLEKRTSLQVFAQKVEEICSLDQKKYEILCRQAQRKIAHLDWSEIVKQTGQVYQKLIDKKKIEDEVKKISKMRKILELLPSSKFKSFLQKQVQKPGVKIKPKKNVWMFAVTVAGTFLIGIAYLFLSKTKRIPTSS